MIADLRQLIQESDAHRVVVRFDRPTGSWIFIVLDDDTLGRPAGGTRMKVYPSAEDGLVDAMRLAAGMTRKWAALGLDHGGAKGVLAVPRPLKGAKREGLLRRYGRLIQELGGGFITGVDLGTTFADMLVVAEETCYVHNAFRQASVTIETGPYTAMGVLAGMRAAAFHRLGSRDLSGRTVLIQGVGSVGAALARQLAAAGAHLKVSDVDLARAGEVTNEVNGAVVAADGVYCEPCDIYAPCADGGTLNRHTIPRLRCLIVAGAANNQLETRADAHRLHECGKLYAPDYVANAGAAIAVTLFDRGVSEEKVRMHVNNIGGTLEVLFSEAAKQGESPLLVAERRVEAVLRRARDKAVGLGQ